MISQLRGAPAVEAGRWRALGHRRRANTAGGRSRGVSGRVGLIVVGRELDDLWLGLLPRRGRRRTPPGAMRRRAWWSCVDDPAQLCLGGRAHPRCPSGGGHRRGARRGRPPTGVRVAQPGGHARRIVFSEKSGSLRRRAWWSCVDDPAQLCLGGRAHPRCPGRGGPRRGARRGRPPTGPRVAQPAGHARRIVCRGRGELSASLECGPQQPRCWHEFRPGRPARAAVVKSDVTVERPRPRPSRLQRHATVAAGCALLGCV